VRKLAGELQPAPDLVIGVDQTWHEPPAHPEQVGKGKVPVVFPGIRGRMLLDLSLARLADGPRLGYSIVSLAGSQTKPGAAEDVDVKDALLQHRHQVADDKVLQAFAGTMPVPNGQSYVGSEKCKECHAAAYDVWTRTLHHNAWNVLVEAEQKRGWPVTAYPDCVGCHVVGYRQKTGFVDFATTPQFAAVGCERCHGAGSAHAQNPVQNKLGKVGNGAPSMVCTQCHDFEQSPDFDYKLKWPLIQHGK
jgi:Cytochrome c554 and c-prime